jgi:enterochelin esterase-like enzyme
MNKPGTLRVAEATPKGYEEVVSLEVFDEHSWSAPAFANGALYTRSMGQLARIDVVSSGSGFSPTEPWIAATGFGRFLADVETAEDKAALIDEYLDSQESFPIIEDSGAVHFLYRGQVEDVGIVGDMIGYRREDPMVRVADTDLYYFSTRLEPDAAVAYGFMVDYGEPIPDPLNDATSDSLFGEVSWFAMPAWQEPDFVAEADPSRRGSLEEIEWTSEVKEGQLRKAMVYLPAGYQSETERRFPTLYFFDGRDALEAGATQNILDNLIDQRIEPVIAVFVLADEENPRGDMRPVDQYLEMIVAELIPMVDGKYRTRPEPMARAAVGVGRAGDAALTAAFEHSQVFERVGSLWPVVFGLEIAEILPEASQQPLVVYHRWGTYHLRSPHEAWDQVTDNREFHRMLQEAGYRPAGGEVPEGYGWPFFRRHTSEMLMTLFPQR